MTENAVKQGFYLFRAGDLFALLRLGSLTKAVHTLFHRSLGHVEFGRDLGLCWPVGFVHEHLLHLFEKPHVARATILFPQSSHYLLEDRKGPTTFVELISGEPVASLDIAVLTLAYLVQRNQVLALTTFGGHCMTRLVHHKIFQRRKQV